MPNIKRIDFLTANVKLVEEILSWLSGNYFSSFGVVLLCSLGWS